MCPCVLFVCSVFFHPQANSLNSLLILVPSISISHTKMEAQLLHPVYVNRYHCSISSYRGVLNEYSAWAVLVRSHQILHHTGRSSTCSIRDSLHSTAFKEHPEYPSLNIQNSWFELNEGDAEDLRSSSKCHGSVFQQTHLLNSFQSLNSFKL